MQADPTPDVALSETDEGVPPQGKLANQSRYVRGDTIICEKPERYTTPNGPRWLWIRILIHRAPEGETDYTVAETVVSTDAAGREYNQRVGLAGIKLDGEKEYTLRDATGVRTGQTKKSEKREHSARGYTIKPNMGPLDATCGGR
jgi:hypothetical protein